MKTLTILSFVLVLTVGPILFVARILYKGKRAFVTIPLTLLLMWAGFMAVTVLNGHDTHHSATARAPQQAAARPAAETQASAPPRGTVVKQNENLWIIEIFDDPSGEHSFIALRVCGANSPDAPATPVAPQGEVLLTSVSQQGDRIDLTIQDAQHPTITYSATSGQCTATGGSVAHNGA